MACSNCASLERRLKQAYEQNSRDRRVLETRNGLDGLPPNYERVLDALESMVEDYEECDMYPTSDEHPLYAARKVLIEAGRRPAPED